MNARDSDVPSTDEAAVEQRVVAAGLTAPRVTPTQVDEQIIREDYYIFPGTTVTVCLLELRNGFCVTGESAAASPENFNAQLGQDIARRSARDKIWSLEGYLLRSALAGPPAQEVLGFEARVKAEASELSAKLQRLGTFITQSPKFAELHQDEQIRLTEQRAYMTGYLERLRARLTALFSGPSTGDAP